MGWSFARGADVPKLFVGWGLGILLWNSPETHENRLGLKGFVLAAGETPALDSEKRAQSIIGRMIHAAIDYFGGCAGFMLVKIFLAAAS